MQVPAQDGVRLPPLPDLSQSSAPVPALPRLRLSIKLLYGVGEFANAARATLFSLFVPFLYTTVMGLPGTLLGIAAAIGLIWDAAVDPVIGHFSDRARARLGRRHSFMLVGAAALGLAFWAHFSPPPGLDTASLFAWFIVSGLLARSASSIFVVPYHALGAELSRDYDERTSLTSFRGGIALLGTLLVASLSFVLFFPNVADGRDPKLNYSGYPAMGLTFGLAMTLAALAATLATLPLRRYLGQARGEATITTASTAAAVSSYASGIATAWRSPSFRALFLSFALVALGVAINGALSIYYVTYYIGLTDSRALSAIQFTFYSAAFLGVLLWLRVSKKVEKRRLYLIGIGAVALLMAAALALLGEGRLLGRGDVRPLLIIQALAGVFGSLFWILPHSMLGDVTDEDEALTGRRREGVFFGMFSFGSQITIGLSSLVIGVLADRYAGLIPGQAEQSPLTVERLAQMFSVLPAAILLVGALAFLPFSLSRRRVAAIHAGLAARSAQPDAHAEGPDTPFTVAPAARHPAELPAV